MQGLVARRPSSAKPCRSEGGGGPRGRTSAAGGRSSGARRTGRPWPPPAVSAPAGPRRAGGARGPTPDQPRSPSPSARAWWCTSARSRTSGSPPWSSLDLRSATVAPGQRAPTDAAPPATGTPRRCATCSTASWAACTTAWRPGDLRPGQDVLEHPSAGARTRGRLTVSKIGCPPMTREGGTAAGDLEALKQDRPGDTPRELDRRIRPARARLDAKLRIGPRSPTQLYDLPSPTAGGQRVATALTDGGSHRVSRVVRCGAAQKVVDQGAQEWVARQEARCSRRSRAGGRPP